VREISDARSLFSAEQVNVLAREKRSTSMVPKFFSLAQRVRVEESSFRREGRRDELLSF